MEKILDIIDLIAYEKGLEHKVVLDIVKDGLIKIAQDEINPLYDYFVEEDSKERTLKLFYRMKVCADNEVLNEEQKARMIPLSVAKKELGDVSVNDEIDCELQLDSMSRGAINKLFLNLEYNLQRSIEDQILQNFRAQLGKIVSGQVVGVDSLGNTFVEIDSIRAVLPQKNRIKGESFKVGDTIRAILKFVGINRNGLQVELSRTTPKFLEELLALEVPEVKDNEVMIHKSARIPGERAKVAVYSHNPRIDPIGCCVGVKGVRINAVSKELANENIDCVEYHNSLEIFVAKALTPAQILSVKIQEPQKDDKNIESTQDSKENQNNEKAPETKRKKAIAQIKTDQKSKAIGKN
ncbi:transcription termination factor NusA, partial [Helicobacter typhlonius]